MCLNVVNTVHKVHRNPKPIRDGKKGGGGTEVGQRKSMYLARMTPALRWAAMRSILMFH